MTKQFLKWAAFVSVLGTLAFGQKVKSPKEGEAVMAIQNATTADARLAAIENLLTKFVDTEFKVIVLEMAIDITRNKGDNVNAVIYCERTLEANPNDLDALSSLARSIAERTRENDLDKDDKVKRVNELSAKCLKVGPEAVKPMANIPDDQWTARKNDYMADCHDALAALAVLNKKPDAAIGEYKSALALRTDPADMVRMAQVYNSEQKWDDALAMLDKVLAIPDLHPTIKQVAGQEKVKAAVGKAKAPKPQQ
jgi:tetratricopeptide (TPR) repeat protein